MSRSRHCLALGLCQVQQVGLASYSLYLEKVRDSGGKEKLKDFGANSVEAVTIQG
uniref:hypothetical protein n=1 Tax=Vaginimicrobium propionicum TaxID=1871034 RepID=UPI0012EB4FDB|nr:hypothetical protein [Vaginimicrobium propionicum]